MSDVKTDLQDPAFAGDDEDDIEILEVVGIDAGLDDDDAALDDEEVVLDLDDDGDILLSDADAVAALEPLPAEVLPEEAPIEPIEDTPVHPPNRAPVAEPPKKERRKPQPRQLTDRERLARLQADFEGYKRRIERERIKYQRDANAGLIRRMLPVLDNFERALSVDTNRDGNNGMRAGVLLIFRQILDELRKEGLKAIEAVGRPFDPTVHEAVETDVESDQPPNTVVAELQRGYMLDDRLLRPALVKVAIDPADQVVKRQLTPMGEDS